MANVIETKKMGGKARADFATDDGVFLFPSPPRFRHQPAGAVADEQLEAEEGVSWRSVHPEDRRQKRGSVALTQEGTRMHGE
jgi:hypothetical protein